MPPKPFKTFVSEKPIPLNEIKFGILGGGKIAESLIQGITSKLSIPPERITLHSKSERTRKKLADTYKIEVTTHGFNVLHRCQIIFLAIPATAIKKKIENRVVPSALYNNFLEPGSKQKPTHIISLVTGVSVEKIAKVLFTSDKDVKMKDFRIELHRAQMNHAISYGRGIVLVDANPTDSKEINSSLVEILSALGFVYGVDRTELDAGCTMIGTGVAIALYLMQSLIEAGTKIGLDRQKSQIFVTNIMESSARTAIDQRKGKSVKTLIEECCPPGGVSIVGIHELGKNDVSLGVWQAFEAAHHCQMNPPPEED